MGLKILLVDWIDLAQGSVRWRVYVKTLLGRIDLAQDSVRWRVYVKTILDRIDLTQGSVRWRVYVKTVLDIWVLQNENFFKLIVPQTSNSH